MKTNYELATPNSLHQRLTRLWNEVFIPKYLENSLLIPKEIANEVEIGIDQHALVGAIGNALADLERWSQFHLKESATDSAPARPDRHKYAGFLAKWVAKERPIYIKLLKNSFVDIPEQLYRANALFAVVVMQSFLKREMPAVLWDELFYVLHFREEKGETLALHAYCGEILGAYELEYGQTDLCLKCDEVECSCLSPSSSKHTAASD